MASQTVPEICTFQNQARLTRRVVQSTRRRIHRIEMAKALVCGVVAADPLNDLRKQFEEMLPMVEEGLRILVCGSLDDLTDEQLRAMIAMLRERDVSMSKILDGSMRIGLEAIEPFPKLLTHFRKLQERLQSQIEGMVLSLDDSFQDVVSKSGGELRTLA